MKQIEDVLKEHEFYCYRIAYFLLEQEKAAILATEQALLELGRNDRFFSESAAERRERAKKVTTKHSLEVSLKLRELLPNG